MICGGWASAAVAVEDGAGVGVGLGSGLDTLAASSMLMASSLLDLVVFIILISCWNGDSSSGYIKGWVWMIIPKVHLVWEFGLPSVSCGGNNMFTRCEFFAKEELCQVLPIWQLLSSWCMFLWWCQLCCVNVALLCVCVQCIYTDDTYIYICFNLPQLCTF